jgi:hypothetical protein
MENYEEFDNKFKDALIEAVAVGVPVIHTAEQKEAAQILDLLMDLDDDILKLKYEYYKKLKKLLTKKTALSSLALLGDYADFFQSLLIEFDYLIDKETQAQIEKYKLKYEHDEDEKENNG